MHDRIAFSQLHSHKALVNTNTKKLYLCLRCYLYACTLKWSHITPDCWIRNTVRQARHLKMLNEVCYLLHSVCGVNTYLKNHVHNVKMSLLTIRVSTVFRQGENWLCHPFFSQCFNTWVIIPKAKLWKLIACEDRLLLLCGNKFNSVLTTKRMTFNKY